MVAAWKRHALVRIFSRSSPFSNGHQSTGAKMFYLSLNTSKKHVLACMSDIRELPIGYSVIISHCNIESFLYRSYCALYVVLHNLITSYHLSVIIIFKVNIYFSTNHALKLAITSVICLQMSTFPGRPYSWSDSRAYSDTSRSRLCPGGRAIPWGMPSDLLSYKESVPCTKHFPLLSFV